MIFDCSGIMCKSDLVWLLQCDTSSFPLAFANPPGNLTCTLALRNNSHQYTQRWIVLNWVPPVLSPFLPPSSYEVISNRFSIISSQTADEPHAELNAEDYIDGVYSLQVRVDRRNSNDPQLPFSHSCIIDTGSILSGRRIIITYVVQCHIVVIHKHCADLPVNYSTTICIVL